MQIPARTRVLLAEVQRDAVPACTQQQPRRSRIQRKARLLRELAVEIGQAAGTREACKCPANGVARGVRLAHCETFPEIGSDDAATQA